MGRGDARLKMTAVADLVAGLGEMNGDLRVAAHDRLGEVLSILNSVLKKYPALHTTDVLTSAATLITKIKSK